ncbi:hypothetical protein NMG60_11037114 [Bertholletia excelsa]
MQIVSEKPTAERVRVPARPPPPSIARYRSASIHGCRSSSAAPAPSPRLPHAYARSSSCNWRSAARECPRLPATAPTGRLRGHRAHKEILRRALSPPARRMGHRCWDFRPTPSRLSNMSMA